MGYSLYLERDPPIALEEWLRVVDAHPGLAQVDEPARATNPETGDEIVLGTQPGDAMAVATQTTWFGFGRSQIELGRLTWLSGRVLLPTFDPTDPDSPAASLFGGVATEIGARVVGDEGEVYDF